MLSRRLQILLDDRRYRRLTLEAGRRRTSVAAVIRDAIDAALPDAGDRRRSAAVAAILAAEPMPLPVEPADLRRELDTARVGVDA